MDIGSVVNQSLIGMQNSRAEITQSAQQIATATTSSEPVDLATPLINIKQQQQQQVFDSSARVLEVADQAIGALLDVKA
ncbi:hypothetical protein [Gilvimarinus polysaccharolyticus]|uniref:hypothetical protein n=1 Tax=Gilvimarinus polysaccharolyticus TaxID=863921 RepID=UPI000673276D|nr:hypothetical protein [Gilvimarinus polysaccharolyticus]